MDIGINPGFFFYVWESFREAIHAEWQSSNKDIGIEYCAGFKIVKLERLACLSHHNLVTWLIADVHGKAMAVCIVTIELAKLGVLDAELSGATAARGVLFPKAVAR